MSLSIQTRITGDRAVRAKLDALAVLSVKALKGVLTKSVLVVEARAKRNVPVITGRLRSSITNEVKQNADGKGFTGKDGTNVDYAPHVEFGTSKSRAKPYLIPALKDSQRDIVNFIKSAFRTLRV